MDQDLMNLNNREVSKFLEIIKNKSKKSETLIRSVIHQFQTS